MAVMVPREKWSDDRLDDLNRKVDHGFTRVDADIRELRNEMNTRFAAIDARFDALNGRLLAGFLMVIATVVGSNVF